uniref:NR LBD domain-containing protein n=1 Tax=Meloidogyne hapla TaxID=6305 RepID=A0A1I8BLC7_MELHA
MKPFNQIKLNEEEYVLLQAIICSHYVTNGVSKQGLELLLNEAEKYCGILIKMLQNNYGQFVGAKRYSELLHLIEFCFKCGYNHSLLFNYLANVFDQNLFHKVMPEALADLCLRCKVSSD